MKSPKKPYVILSAAMTIDGKIASKTGDPELSDEADWKEVHKLRTKVDAIMVGKGTILKDNPKLHIKYFSHKGYYRIVVDSHLTIPLDANVITYEPALYPTIICTTENISSSRITLYQARGITIIQAGKGVKVDLSRALEALSDMGIKKILLEGGGTLNWGFLEKDLIDEIRLTIAPWFVGGKHAVSLVDGEGFDKMSECPRYHLINVKKRENYLTLNYKRMRS
ncbi:MAG: 2,5-diamino-6-(ribosylamino)-4(3H)-pyrimidinone 5'-phosphate reductase [Promethearchaeota archaeon]